MEKWMENCDKTLAMPDRTVEEIRNKINCFTADEIEMNIERQGLENQLDIAKCHVRDLFLKLRDKLQNK